ncbi:hypothetical protein LZ554_000743 [Drepanopeziza brunnea f. sp. 'monogermtubi']|nr:hypothetical protein LZ554_000743 [Drepanopeziza brunnea f. sp. 'monogermtubi']
MSQIGEYTVLPLTIPSTPAYPKPATHTLYLRPHAPNIPTANDSRSLFLVNVPIDSTSAHIRAVIVSLLGAGRFESVSFEHETKTQATPSTPVQAQPTNKKRKRGDVDTVPEELPYTWNRKLRRSGSTAVVLLVDERSVENALKAARKISRSGKERSRPVWGGDGVADVPELGSRRYAAHQELRFPSREELQRNVDSFMTGFNALEEAKAKEAKRARNVPDADGFVTVVRGGSRTGPARVEDAERKRAEMEAKERERREGLRTGGFYRFQVRERRKEEQGELVKRFEEDRRRVGEMKERRGRFRPEK